MCEEAHRHAPANPALGFEPAREALARIAKEVRKYGVSLCIVSQRPAAARQPAFVAAVVERWCCQRR